VEGEYATLVVCCMVQTPVVDLLDKNDLMLSSGKPEKDKTFAPSTKDLERGMLGFLTPFPYQMPYNPLPIRSRVVLPFPTFVNRTS